MRSALVVALLAITVAVQAATWDANAILAKHNYERKAWGLTAMYSIDGHLAAGAQAYADQCNFGHSSYDHRKNDYASRKGDANAGCVGENLAANVGTTIDDNGWHSEREWWTCSSNACATGKACGHYTQVVWANSIRIGCGVQTCTTGSPFSGYPTWNILVCWYNPCGNFNNEHPLGGTHLCSYNPPVDCVVSPWSPWSTCSATCGGGTQTRTRSVTTSPSNGGASCPALTESEACNTQDCPVDCTWNSWGTWSTCSAECMPGGMQTRTRTQNSAQNGGAECTGSSSETQACNADTPCPIHCTWNEWSEWTPCTLACGGGEMNRTRTQNAAQYGGLACTGESLQIEPCNTAACSVNCTWNPWSVYLNCSAECGGGTRTRTRTFTPAQDGGAPCSGMSIETTDCNEQPCLADCQVGSWSTWSSCTASCGGGVQERTRVVTTNSGADCPALKESVSCNTQVCLDKPLVDCVLSEWSAWSICSLECGGGSQSRSREVTTQQANGGVACPMPLLETQWCNTNECSSTRLVNTPDDFESHPSDQNADADGADTKDEGGMGITSDVGGLPMWAWIVIGIGGLLVLAGIIVGIVFGVKNANNSSPFSKKYYEMY